MKGKRQFTKHEADQIRLLLERKINANRDQQKTIRASMRNLGFYISDFTSSTAGFTPEDFESLVRHGQVHVL